MYEAARFSTEGRTLTMCVCVEVRKALLSGNALVPWFGPQVQTKRRGNRTGSRLLFLVSRTYSPGPQILPAFSVAGDVQMRAGAR